MACEIVIVEDDPEFASSLADVLEHEGHEVEIFATPEAAFERLLAKGRASLVLLDLRTPGMSAQRFRALLMSAPGLRAPGPHGARAAPAPEMAPRRPATSTS